MTFASTIDARNAVRDDISREIWHFRRRFTRNVAFSTPIRVKIVHRNDNDRRLGSDFREKWKKVNWVVFERFNEFDTPGLEKVNLDTSLTDARDSRELRDF